MTDALRALAPDWRARGWHATRTVWFTVPVGSLAAARWLTLGARYWLNYDHADSRHRGLSRF